MPDPHKLALRAEPLGHPRHVPISEATNGLADNLHRAC